jgi:hypothetical protein
MAEFGSSIKNRRRYKDLGFEELSPRKIANELLANLSVGDEIAILGHHFKGDDDKNSAMDKVVQDVG